MTASDLQGFCEGLNTDSSRVDTLARIPFLPVRFFKSMGVKTGEFEP